MDWYEQFLALFPGRLAMSTPHRFGKEMNHLK